MKKINLTIPFTEDAQKEVIQIVAIGLLTIYPDAGICVLDDDNQDITRETLQHVTPETQLIANEYLQELRKG